MDNNNTEFKEIPGSTFEADPEWTHDVARDVMKFLSEKWNVDRVTFNKDWIWNLYNIVRIIKQHYGTKD